MNLRRCFLGLFIASKLRVNRISALRWNINPSHILPSAKFYSVASIPTLNHNRMSATKNQNNFDNVLLQDWSKYEFGLPPFTTSKPSDFEEALKVSMGMHVDQVRDIASNTEEPSFENTIAAFDRAGGVFNQVMNLFDNLCSSNGVPELQAVELKMAGPLAAHHNQISTFPGLFDRINAVYEKRLSSGLNPEQIRLVERFHLDFVRAGMYNSI